MAADKLARIPDWMILLAFCTLFSVQVVMSIQQKSATWDEPQNLASGYVELRFGDYWMMPRNLPFVKQLAALPLLFLSVQVPPPPHISNKVFIFGARFLYESNDGDRLLFLSRLAVLPLSLFLGCAVFLWAKQLFGKAAALFSLFLYAFEPNILAHSGLVTTDLAAACLMFVIIYGLYRAVYRVSLAGLLLPGLAFGLALLTKYTLLPLAFILLLLALIASLSHQPLDIRISGLPWVHVRRWRGKLLGFLVIFLCWGMVAYGLIWSVYGFRYEALVIPGLASPRSWEQVLPPEPLLHNALSWAREARLLPEGYLYGFAETLSASGGYDAFLMGEIRRGSWWYYFLVTLLIKTPIPLLLLGLLAAWLQWARWREDPLRAAFLLVPILLYFGFISASGYNIGHRHLLPIYPFLFVLVSALIPWVVGQARLLQGGVAVLAAWYLVTSVAIYPHYLAYFNELVGGPENGYKYLVDSNLDWGQDLKGLKRYMDAHGIPRVWLSYFGTADPKYYGISYNYLTSNFIFRPSTEKAPTPFVAISATNLQGVYMRGGWSTDFLKVLRTRKPVAKIGYSIFLYRLE